MLLFLLFTLFTLGPVLTLVALVVLFAATHTYFLPITYHLSPNGVTVDKRIFTYTYEWSRFRRYFRTSGGIVLSPFSRHNFLDNFRGVHLLLPSDDEAIVACLEKRFKEVPDDGL